MTVTDTSWLRECSDLVAGTPSSGVGQIVEAQRIVAEVLDSAAVYVSHTDCLHLATGSCALDGVPGGRAACELARAFAPHSDTAGEGGTARYLAALGHAPAAVYYCRKVAHPTGACWFAPPLGVLPAADDLCARVLATAHALG